ncbi:MAG: hypothetical protein EOR72_05995 [Mesorhizobium sp.]|uniref:hypothetical protein n=1 Tax=Mesorhizobium sp. TaxID=1871066 RepID=UPI000FE80886|nr:hypothetical protein [Mesorhizobium sp.]RWM18102.1 MAG: hypothetical protein EOR72_05995 [Mesorhizobium sp.]
MRCYCALFQRSEGRLPVIACPVSGLLWRNNEGASAWPEEAAYVTIRHVWPNAMPMLHRDSKLPARRFLGDYGAGLLIVRKLFFIQRRDGEVAEWSKALPC